MQTLRSFWLILCTVSLASASRTGEPALEPVLQTGHTALVRNVAFSGDAKLVVTGSADGTTILWDPATGKEVCRLVSLNGSKDWLALTTARHFDGSDCAWNYVSFRAAGMLQLADDDATCQRFRRRGLLAELYKCQQPKR